MEITRELVLRKLHIAFPDESVAAEALAMLDGYGVQPWHRERGRVQLAILKQCGGTLKGLTFMVEMADRDYRDVLVGAEYPEEFRVWSQEDKIKLPEIRKRDREQYEAWLRSKS